MSGWLIDKSALVRLGSSPESSTWATRIERGLVRVSTVTLLEVGHRRAPSADRQRSSPGLLWPPSGAGASSKLRRYRIDDPYLRFWFRFVEGHVDDVARGRPDIPTARFGSGWSSWRGRSIEPVVLDALTLLAAHDGRLGGAETVGAWWNRDGSTEVDVVARRAGTVPALGTVTWRQHSGVTGQELTALARARAVVPGAQSASLLAICPAGATPAASPDGVVTAEQLLDAWR